MIMIDPEKFSSQLHCARLTADTGTFNNPARAHFADKENSLNEKKKKSKRKRSNQF